MAERVLSASSVISRLAESPDVKGSPLATVDHLRGLAEAIPEDRRLAFPLLEARLGD